MEMGGNVQSQIQQMIQGLEAVGTITAATQLIEVKQRKVRKTISTLSLYLHKLNYLINTECKIKPFCISSQGTNFFIHPHPIFFPFPSDNRAAKRPTEGRSGGGGGADEEAVGGHHGQMDQPEHKEPREVSMDDGKYRNEDVVKTSLSDGSTRTQRTRRSKY